LVLVTDRSDLSPDRLEQMQSDIIQVIRNYIEIEADAVQIKLEHRHRKTYLVADVPLERDHKYDAALAAPDAPDDSPPDEA
jgi:cell division topological specificity factor